MADVITPNLSLTEPEVGASTYTWGNKLNGNCDILDALFAVTKTTPLGSIATQQASNVAINGGVITTCYVNGGVINNSTIGLTTPAAGKFTTVEFADGTSVSSSPPFSTFAYTSSASLPNGYGYILCYVDASSGASTITLPSAPSSNGFRVVVMKYDTTPNAVTVVAASGDGIFTGNPILQRTYSAVYLVCDAGRRTWVLAGSSNFGGGGTTKTLQQVFTSSGTFYPSAGLVAAGGSVQALVIGGGGGGGTATNGGGGGGGGGFIRRWATVMSATGVTVGAGGGAGAAGGASSFAGITAGGGQPGTSGSPYIGGASGSPIVNPGGNPAYTGAGNFYFGAGGGAGCGGAGLSPTGWYDGTQFNSRDGAGGPGLEGYAGGGGGGGESSGGTASAPLYGLGSCGGGNGGNSSIAGTSGQANTGGGGGGAGSGGLGAGAGGSGIVILTWNE